MTISGDLLQSTGDTIALLGTTCTVHVVSATLTAAGAVTETTTEHTGVPCSDVQDGDLEYGAAGTDLRTIAGSMYLPALDLGFVPAVGNRVVYRSRKFEVVRVGVKAIQGVTIAYKLALAEVPA